MATVRLLKERRIKVDDKEVVQKKGDLVSVPFLKAREMFAAGEAEQPVLPTPASPAKGGGTDWQAIAAKLKAENATLVTENERLMAELDKATKPIEPKK